VIDAYGTHLIPLNIHFYALLTVSRRVAMWLAAQQVQAQTLKIEHGWNRLLCLVIPAWFGTRLDHGITPTPTSDLTTSALDVPHPRDIVFSPIMHLRKQQ
jgi:hypothetical protein